MLDRQQYWAVGVSVALHLAALGMLASHSSVALRERAATPEPTIVTMVMVPPSPPPSTEKPAPPASTPPPAPIARSIRPSPSPSMPVALQPIPEATATPQLRQAYMDAPPAPSAEEWALAGTYKLKNSKRYRHTWGQQVRSLMGTAREGPEQGTVRFRIEIAPSGQLARLDTLWTTSDTVEQLARTAVQNMPPLPPTPNGKPLVFEKTIVFDAFTAESPPLYKNDCEPDPPQHGNRFVWDGRSPQVVAAQPEAEPLDPATYAECLKQLPQDSIEAEAASDKRQLEQWASPRLGR
jgi:TonB family protein